MEQHKRDQIHNYINMNFKEEKMIEIQGNTNNSTMKIGNFSKFLLEID